MITNEITNVETEEKWIVAAYALDTSPVIYIGELDASMDVIQDDRLVFKKLLVQIQRMPQLAAGQKPSPGMRPEILWSPAVGAGRESIVVLDRTSQPGCLILAPDQHLVDEYKREMAKIYSGIHLL